MARRDTTDDPATDDRADYDYTGGDVERPGLVADVEALVDGDVRFDAYSRQLYATDASAYEVTPIGVVFPRSTDDVASVVSYCADRGVPVLPRGGGTSLAGQTVNEAVVLDFTRYMDDVLDVDPDARECLVEPGAVLDEIDELLAPHGLKFAPDPATSDRSAVGGAIGNNTTGAHSLKYGKTDAYVESVEVVLSDGTVARLGETTLDDLAARADPDGDAEARLYAAAKRVIDEERDAVRDAYPSLKRNVSGYNLDVLVEEADRARDPDDDRETVNLARLIAGSEGTLAVVTAARLSLEPVPETKAVALLTYESLRDAMADVGAILDHDPAAVEVLDDVLLDLAGDLDEYADAVDRFPDGTDAVLLVEFYADDEAAGRATVRDLLDDRVGDRAVDAIEAHDPADRERWWGLRKAGAAILLSRTTDEKHVAFVEDIAVPPEHLPEYVEDFRSILADEGTFASFYAHAGPGCVHVRPLVNTRTEAGRASMERIADRATDLAVTYGGAVSGEHGDGRARTQWNRKLYGDHLWQVFRDLKTAVDPDWLLNPGPVCGEVGLTENLRFDSEYEFDPEFDPELRWEVDNGFRGMAELCHGCGACRGDQSTTGGVMCPTYRAAEEEIQSTRGRANLLRQAMSGDLDADARDPEFLREVLDLCVGCKGCSLDCPSEVDLAKLKVEVEHAHVERHGASLRARLFGDVHRLARLGSALAPASNWLPELPGARALLERTIGVARERSLPTFAGESLADWFAGRESPVADPERRALLFPDTFTTYANPGIGRAAVRALEAAGVRVELADGVTGSGRPPYSKGLLDTARRRARRNVAALAPRVREGWDVVVVEPSDAVMLQSDYHDLLSGGDVDDVAANTHGVMEYLDRFRLDDELAVDAPNWRVTYHGHCHQTATKRDHHAVGVLRRAGYRVDPLDSTCCGMAGTFGYEAEHHSMSRAIGRILCDQIEASGGDLVVAPGTSCRTQLYDIFDRRVAHPVETLTAALD